MSLLNSGPWWTKRIRGSSIEFKVWQTSAPDGAQVPKTLSSNVLFCRIVHTAVKLLGQHIWDHHSASSIMALTLYHVTHLDNLPSIMHNGLVPTSARQHDTKLYGAKELSNPNMVYLTRDLWLPYEFGGKRNPLVVLKVTVPTTSKLYPDEDFLDDSAVLHKIQELEYLNYDRGNGKEFTKVLHEAQETHQHLWVNSLRGRKLRRTWPVNPKSTPWRSKRSLGTVAYKGVIPPENIEIYEYWPHFASKRMPKVLESLKLKTIPLRRRDIAARLLRVAKLLLT